MQYRLLNRLIILFFSLTLIDCNKHPIKSQAYIDNDLIYVSSSQSGELIKTNVAKGDQVKKGQLLFQIDNRLELIKLHQAITDLNKAVANLRDLNLGERPTEISQIVAEIQQTKSQLIYTKKQLQTNIQIVIKNSTAIENLDKAKRNFKISLAQLHKLQQKLITAKLPARINLLLKAQDEIQSAKFNVNYYKQQLSYTTVRSNTDGVIFDVYYLPGEQVAAQHPVMSILNKNRSRILFYLSQKYMTTIHLGDKIFVHANSLVSNNMKTNSVATITYISSKAEYTPPVIYSLSRQDKLVYKIEAKFDNLKNNDIFLPGQLLTVTIKQ